MRSSPLQPPASEPLVFLRETARLALRSPSVEEAFLRCEEHACAFLGWPMAHVLLTHPRLAGLVDSGLWWPAQEAPGDAFVQATRALRLTEGEGVVGRVVATGEPVWIADLVQEPSFVRADAARRLGLRSMIAVPLVRHGSVGGVLELFHHEVTEPDATRLAALAQLGLHLGRLLERVEARESSQRLEALFRHALEGILFADDEGRYVDANPTVCALTGYAREDLLGLSVWDLTPATHRDEGRATWRRFLAEGRGEGRYLLRRKDGGKVLVEYRAVAAVAPGLHLSVLREVSEARLDEESSREFLALLAHELRNPLAAIGNVVGLMEEPEAGGELLETSLGVLRRQVAHMTRMVDDLLDVSRMTRGRLRLRREAVDVGAVIARALEGARSSAGRRRQEIRVETPREALWVEGDGERLVQVVENLLDNASKFSAAGQRIRLVTAAEKERVVVRVIDEGRGIAADRLPRVFEPFEQGETTPDRSRGGLGLGLTLVRRIVELHGGEVGVQSTPGAGSEFRVSLPRTTAPEEPEAPSEPAAPSATAKLRVLLAEDHADAALALATLLRRRGMDVRIASDGQEALELARRFAPDVVLLDLGLPVMDGFEVARRLRAEGALPGLRIVALTGYAQDHDRRRAREAGVDLHLTKPVGKEELLAVLARMRPQTSAGRGTSRLR